MNNLQALIHGALDNALDHGYDLSSITALEIANDLIASDADFEDCTPEELIPYIQAWWSCV